MTNKKEKILSSLNFIILILIGHFLIINNNNNLEKNVDSISKELLNSQSLIVERTIKRNTSSATILGKYVELSNGDMSKFEVYAKTIHTQLEGVTNLQLAPDGIITKIYPLEGHEKALGHNIFKDDRRKKEAFLAKESSKLTIAGPFKLIQGGVAIIARKPVYINNKFWGFASALIMLDDLVKVTELHKLKSKNFLFRLKRIHPDTNKMEVFYGEKNLPNEKVFTKKIELPNSKWYLDIEYIGEYIPNSILYILYLLNLIISFLLSYLLYIILIKPKELSQKIKEQTITLKKREDTLSEYVLFSRTDLKGIITDVSDAFCKLSGYSKDELIGSHHSLVRHADMPKSLFKEIWNNLKNQKNWKGEIKNLTKDGHYYWVEAFMSPEYDNNNNLIGYLSIRHDITAKKDFEKQHLQLIEQSKMAAMGEMIGNIAHQWRQPLNAISVSASGLKFKYDMDSLSKNDIHSLVNNIMKNTNYLSETIDVFKDFIKEKRLYKKVILQDRISISLDIIKESLKANHIEIINNIENVKPVEINIVIGELSQVIINIINNAKDALIERNIENPWVKVELEKEKNVVKILIEDNAGGIDEDVLTHIFEPYFTTKHKSQGTGLGLHMSYKIIVEHLKGNIYAKNTENGAKFYIELPLNY